MEHKNHICNQLLLNNSGMTIYFGATSGGNRDVNMSVKAEMICNIYLYLNEQPCKSTYNVNVYKKH